MEFNFRDLSAEELETRKAELRDLVETEGADLDAIEEEARAIKAELEERMKAEAERAEQRKEVAEMVLPAVEESPIEERKMENIEIRDKQEYIDAFAKYVRTGDDAECRALLTENGSGTVAVPTLVYDTIKTAWEKDGIMRLVKKAYMKGNLKVGFEISSSDAVAHTEGQAVNEESLVMGIISLVPQAIKKWISISDEALDMDSGAYLRYIYDELTYRIAKKAAQTLISKITTAGTQSTTTAVAVASIAASGVSVSLVAEAMANLSAEAANPVVVMNRQTWGAFKAAQAANGFNYDPFEGLPVVFNDDIKSVSAATTGEAFLIVGDFGHGALANFPGGEEISVKRDDYTLATSDLVRFIGREYVALGIVAPFAFCTVKKN